MTLENSSSTNTYVVSYSPTNKQVGEIERWLIAEQKKTGEGFYCNWNIIKSSFGANELAVISLKSSIIGFATWRITSKNTARIEIAEVKPTHRNMGVGKRLVVNILDFLKVKGICVVDLKCAPEDSEPIWKRLGFVKFPDLPGNYRMKSYNNNHLYTILIEHLQTNAIEQSDEVIELWNNEPYAKIENTSPTYIWNVSYMEGSRILSKPIIHPAHYDWRIRWRKGGTTIIDEKVKRFCLRIDFGDFIIIKELPV